MKLGIKIALFSFGTIALGAATYLFTRKGKASSKVKSNAKPTQAVIQTATKPTASTKAQNDADLINSIIGLFPKKKPKPASTTQTATSTSAAQAQNNAVFTNTTTASSSDPNKVVWLEANKATAVRNYNGMSGKSLMNYDKGEIVGTIKKSTYDQIANMNSWIYITFVEDKNNVVGTGYIQKKDVNISTYKPK